MAEERYTTIAAIDIGTSKVSCAIAHIGGENGSISVIGKGTYPNQGMRKGVVTDIEKTGAAIRAAVDAAERLSGYHIEHATITISGNHVQGQNTSGQVAVANPDREIRDDDVDLSLRSAVRSKCRTRACFSMFCHRATSWTAKRGFNSLAA